MRTIVKRSFILVLAFMMVITFVPYMGGMGKVYAEDDPVQEEAVPEEVQNTDPVPEEPVVTEPAEEPPAEIIQAQEDEDAVESVPEEPAEEITKDEEPEVITEAVPKAKAPLRSEPKTISLDNGEFSISQLIDEQGLASDDVLEIGSNVVLNVDVFLEIKRIEPYSIGVNSLTIEGDQTLRVANGINLGSDSTLTMESGTLSVEGQYNDLGFGISAYNVIVNGGTIKVMFDDTTNPNQYGFYGTSYFTLNDGEVCIDISGSRSGYACGIYTEDDNTSININGGTLDMDIENSFGYAYGTFNNWSSSTYNPVTINGGNTDISIKRTGGDNYADAVGIAGESVSLFMNDGSLSVDVKNTGQDGFGIQGDYFNISGGTLYVFGGTTTEGRNGYGIYTSQDAELHISGGDTFIYGNTYSTASGEGIGIYYKNSSAAKRIDISGGILETRGTTNGIYVNNSTDNAIGINQIYGTADVTVFGQTGAAIYGVRDSGWNIFGDAELNSKSTTSNGINTNGELNVYDTPSVTFEGYNNSGENTCAVYADQGITVGNLLRIMTEDGAGVIREDGKNINSEGTGRRAQKVIIYPKELTKACVMFFDEVTGQTIKDGSVRVQLNNGSYVEAGADPVKFNVPKGEDFTLTASAAPGSTYTFNGWVKNAYPGTVFNRDETITQNISQETWYYAEFSPPKTEINSLTFTADSVLLPGKTKEECVPTITVAEEGVSTLSTSSWLDLEKHHLPAGHVFESGEQVMLMFHYYVDKSYKLADDIELHTTFNGQIPNDHDVTNKFIYKQYVVPYDISGAEVSGIVDKTYTGSGIKQTPSVVFDGTTLTEGSDYTISYENNVELGTATMTITGIGSYYGQIEKTFNIVPKPIGKTTITLSASSYTYNGKVNTPTVTIKNGSKKLVRNTDYTLTYASGRKNVGSYKITIKGLGNYSGSTTKTFTINPKGTSVKSLVAYKKALTVKWTKQSTKMSASRITGYQIQLATDSKFTKNVKTVTVAGYSKVARKVTGLKAKTKYYVRIRTYKTVSGTKYYSPWSAVKYKKTK